MAASFRVMNNILHVRVLSHAFTQIAHQSRGFAVKRCCLLNSAESKQSDENVANASTSAEFPVALQELKEQNESLKTQLNESQDKYKRSLAEMQNVRQRLQKQIEDAKLFGIQGFCKDLLEVADVLGKATETIAVQDVASTSNPSLKILHEGLLMTESQLQKVFVRHGLAKICPAEGDKFDPNLHEALFQQSSADKVPGTVSTVTKVGYTLHNRTLRPAIVGVFRSS